MVYSYVFDTGTIDKKTLARVYTIGKRREQRRQNVAARKNNFKLENLGHHHFALLRTCRRIHAEVTAYLKSKFVIRFTSLLVIANFLCGGDLESPHFSTRNLDVLDKSLKVQVMLAPAPQYWMEPLFLVARSPLNELRDLQLTFVNKDDVDATPSPACEFIQSRFDQSMTMYHRLGQARDSVWNSR